MTDEQKRFILESVRKSYATFIQEVLKVPSSPMHKQQAIFRFEEASMWLQNGIVSYQAPAAPAQSEPSSDVPPASVEVAPEDPAANEESAEPVTPEPTPEQAQ